jgi:ATP-binding cassette subfamily F protein 3
VALARLLIKPGNFLLMDEPTNHLDLASAEELAASLESYDGTLIFVSHNRAFVRRLATRIWNVADGTVETYPGTLDEYMDTCRQRQAAEEAAAAGLPAPAPKPSAPKPEKKVAPPPAAAVPAPAPKPAPVDKPKQSKNRVAKLEREIADLETKIAALEGAQKQRSELLANPTVYADKAQSTKLLEEFRKEQPELEKLTARWEQLQVELDGLAGS